MELKMETRKELINRFSKSYQKAVKSQKGKILDTFVAASGYTRHYASYLLRYNNKTIKRIINGRLVIYKVNVHKRKKRQGKRIYDDEVYKILRKLWYTSYFLCGKLFKAGIPDYLISLKKDNDFIISDEVRSKLLKISSPTIDRLLKKDKDKMRIKGISQTKSGTSLINLIPTKTFSELDRENPGFVEIDLVSHCGGNARGDFCQTLDITDIASCWTETKAVKNKAQKWVFAALKDLRDKFPFKVNEIHSDNGSEFINNELYRYCKQEKLLFSRSRAGKKNDNCYVEQKNCSIVRKFVGYYRYDTEEELKLLNELYRTLRDYTNYFRPVMKTKSKTRIGSKVKRVFDEPKTPYRRLLSDKNISEEIKEELTDRFNSLNVSVLVKNIVRIQGKLMELSDKKRVINEEVLQKK